MKPIYRVEIFTAPINGGEKRNFPLTDFYERESEARRAAVRVGMMKCKDIHNLLIGVGGSLNDKRLNRDDISVVKYNLFV